VPPNESSSISKHWCDGVIEVRNLRYRYPGSEGPDFALRDVSFSLEAGEWLGLMGANGSGKTTFVRCLNGLNRPSFGQVLVDGLSTDDPHALYEIRKRVGMVFQNPDNQIVATSVEREIAFGLENLGIPVRSMRKQVAAALKRFSLEPYAQISPNRLSGGERQRLALASVWTMEPRYLILDEPTSLLDPAGKRDFFQLIRRMLKTRKVGILLVTQYPEETLDCDRLLVMDRGCIRFNSDPVSVFRHRSPLRRLGLSVPVEAELGALFA